MTEARTDYNARTKYFGMAAEGYEGSRRGQGKWPAEQAVVREFVAEARPGESVLDVPFGTGRFAGFYLERGLAVHGADISADMLVQAGDTLGDDAAECRLLVADALDLPYDDRSFDYLVCNRFIKWLPELDLVDRALGEFARVCRGRLLIQWNMKRSGMRLLAKPKSASGTGKTKHSKSDIYALCRKNGLDIVDDFLLPGGTKSVRYLVLTPFALGEAG